jgi:hypothetical protein
MPNYTFIDLDTEVEHDDTLTVAKMEEYLEANPRKRVVIKQSNFISGTGMKVSDGFKDILKTIKRNNPGSNIDV